MVAASDISITWIEPHSNISKEAFKKVKILNVLQADYYLRAMRNFKGFSVRTAMVEISGVNAGIFSVLEQKALGGFLHVVMLDRGPIWFDEFGQASDFEWFLDALIDEFPKRPGRVLRILPEMGGCKAVENALKSRGFKGGAAPYESIMLDLTQPIEDLRSNLRKNWRGALKKAEKSELTVDWASTAQTLEWLMKFYGFDKRTKGYSGPGRIIYESRRTRSVERKGSLDRAGDG